MSRNGNATRVGALLAAIGASACCWVPLLLVALGAGTTGVGAFFDSARPYLMAATVLLLGGAFYYTYRRETVCATDGSCSAVDPSVRAKMMLWGITVVALFSFAFPYWSEARLGAANADEAALGEPTFEIPVGGMTCAACAITVHEAAASVPGVEAVRVEEAPGRVRVWGEVDPAHVAEAIRKVGYTAGVAAIKTTEAAKKPRTAYVEVKGMVQQLGIT